MLGTEEKEKGSGLGNEVVGLSYFPPEEGQVWGDVRPMWDLVGGRGLGEATRERHPGLKED